MNKEQISVGGWAEGGELLLQKGNMRNPYGDGRVLYLDSGSGYMNLHMIKYIGPKIYTHKHKKKQVKLGISNKINGLYQCQYPG